MSKLLEQLKYEEGLRLKAYVDTRGHKTIGYGHNLDNSPYFLDHQRISDSINKETAEELLRMDVARTEAELREKWPRLDEFGKERRDAFIAMAYQLGVNGFMGFERMRYAALARDWETAAKEALYSNWAKQTPNRAKRVTWQIKFGKYYEIPL